MLFLLSLSFDCDIDVDFVASVVLLVLFDVIFISDGVAGEGVL